MPLFEPSYIDDPRYTADVLEAPSEVMQLHDELIKSHDVELSDDLTELFINGGRLSVTECGPGYVTVNIWPLTGGSPLVLAENMPSENALGFLMYVQP